MNDYVLAMELRDVRAAERVVVGVCAPYDETSYLVPDPMGERVKRGAFARSIAARGGKVPLLRAHDAGRRMGTSRSFTESDDGLLGEFTVNAGDSGDALLEDCRLGYLAALSCGFQPIRAERGPDGVREVLEAKLVEVSLVGVPAYDGAQLVAVRAAAPIVPAFPPRPDVNLAPIPPLMYRPR